MLYKRKQLLINIIYVVVSRCHGRSRSFAKLEIYMGYCTRKRFQYKWFRNPISGKASHN